MSWTQPVCDACFYRRYPPTIAVQPYRIRDEHRDTKRCCDCGTLTRSGLYIRVNPATIAHPRPS